MGAQGDASCEANECAVGPLVKGDVVAGDGGAAVADGELGGVVREARQMGPPHVDCVFQVKGHVRDHN